MVEVNRRLYMDEHSGQKKQQFEQVRTAVGRFIVTATERYVNVAPQVSNGLVFMSTVSRPPNGRGALYALDAETGVVRWRFDTIKGSWAVPSEASGGGAWYAPSVDGDDVYW